MAVANYLPPGNQTPDFSVLATDNVMGIIDFVIKRLQIKSNQCFGNWTSLSRQIEIPEPYQNLNAKQTFMTACEEMIPRISQIKQQIVADIRLAQHTEKVKNSTQIKLDISQYQNRFNYLIEIAVKLKLNFDTVEEICHQRNVPSPSKIIFKSLTKMVNSLIQGIAQDSFLLSLQPCQLIKSTKGIARFYKSLDGISMEVSFLTGNKLGLGLVRPEVSVCLVDEKTCRKIYSEKTSGTNLSWVKQKDKMVTNHVRLEYVQDKDCWKAFFRDVTLIGFGRKKNGSGKGSLVTDEKLVILFQMNFKFGDVNIHVYTLSLPVVVSTHWSQDCRAWATVSLYNQFGSIDKTPFMDDEQVERDGVMNMLKNRFAAMVGSELSIENKKYLEQRLLEIPIHSSDLYYPSSIVYKIAISDLCKKHGAEGTFSWSWFYEATALIQKYNCFKSAWEKGQFLGFIGMEEANLLLKDSECPAGTFLLRFCKKTLEGISIVWLHSDGNAYSMESFTLGQNGLSPETTVALLNMDHLKYVYKSKGSVFDEETKMSIFNEFYVLAKRIRNSRKIAGLDCVQYTFSATLNTPSLPPFIENNLTVSPSVHILGRTGNVQKESSDIPDNDTNGNHCTVQSGQGEEACQISSATQNGNEIPGSDYFNTAQEAVTGLGNAMDIDYNWPGSNNEIDWKEFFNEIDWSKLPDFLS